MLKVQFANLQQQLIASQWEKNMRRFVFVKQSGGWRKTFPDKEPTNLNFDLSTEGSWCIENLRMLSGCAAERHFIQRSTDSFCQQGLHP